jgi:hypothetical protein
VSGQKDDPPLLLYFAKHIACMAGSMPHEPLTEGAKSCWLCNQVARFSSYLIPQIAERRTPAN